MFGKEKYNYEKMQNQVEELNDRNIELKNQLAKLNRMAELIKQQKVDIDRFRQLCINILRLQYHEDLPNLVDISSEDLCLLAAENLDEYIISICKKYDNVANKYLGLHHETKLLVEKYIYFLVKHGLSRGDASKLIDNPDKVFEFLISHPEDIGESSATSHYMCETIKEKGIDSFSKVEMQVVQEAEKQKKHMSKDKVLNQNSNNCSNQKRPVRVFSKHEEKILKKLSGDFGDVEWAIIEAIGLFGLSQRKEIVEQVEELVDYKSKPTKINTSIKTLAEADIIKIEKVNLPRAGSVDIIQLGENGVKLFAYNFDKEPDESEAHKIIVEHDNLLHGYSIIFLGLDLLETYRYSDVSTMNKRRGKEVTINNNKTVYVPDLICTDYSGNAEYYEYELDNHNIKNFCIKCDKMIQVTDTLRFVVPNKSVALSLNKKMETWLSEKSTYSLMNTFIKIYTYRSLVEENRALIEYDLSVSKAPVYSCLQTR